MLVVQALLSLVLVYMSLTFYVFTLSRLIVIAFVHFVVVLTIYIFFNYTFFNYELIYIYFGIVVHVPLTCFASQTRI